MSQKLIWVSILKEMGVLQRYHKRWFYNHCPCPVAMFQAIVTSRTVTDFFCFCLILKTKRYSNKVMALKNRRFMALKRVLPKRLITIYQVDLGWLCQFTFKWLIVTFFSSWFLSRLPFFICWSRVAFNSKLRSELFRMIHTLV